MIGARDSLIAFWWVRLAMVILLLHPAHTLAAPQFRGVCYVTWGTPNVLLTKESDDQIRRLHALGVNCIAFRVTWLQESFDSVDLHPGFATPSDDSVRHVVHLCHSLGMKAMVALLVDFADHTKGGSYRWRGQIAPAAAEGGGADEAWKQWFDSYEKFALHYAKLCEESGADVFSFGAEMTNATTQFDQPWRELIRKVRDIYRGTLTYQANWSPLQYAFGGGGAASLVKQNQWNAEYKTVKFWDALDCAALSSYFSLTDKRNPGLEELAANWQVWLEDLRAWQREIKKPVLFSEVGYQSADRGAIEPWRTPLSTLPNPDLQARCYEAFLKTFYEESWVKGICWWMACPPKEWGVDKHGGGYPFLGKPAEEVVRRWFGK
ncbi:MAG: hypothetical protein AUJ92_10905 [Armatimonadetes bacterium CG2_30_59_28]|nr:hypothetical protein [Armatimonadota bacterium]OIO94101.1 MAG: hypothetical protein AUJ92_10905 [Armatimonadetes bacterium CG2_30_59_28]PIU67553.1 MAG: hypothetical protein COS85_00180 [Armatimonadetes bacterium CG07_land_8_20_14_0_80_59_28]PIX41824.1 MAG: hypothetical protein COZ56_10895 [Armatimonadetes bacterium CG_4_8_14_3_um_filter_58_9]PIY43053.1 MAG: hypothetical protein COZ05_12260 [Armatimonadetes bacterium CG_4_10_14_3_um_filter_59_10]PJB74369.1 MAG: hypothetical protein CO095_048